jgi:hypothetical protein
MSYADLSTFKARLYNGATPPTSEELDARLQSILGTAASWIDQKCNRTFVVPDGTETRTYSTLVGEVFCDDIADVLSITVEYDGEEVSWRADPVSHLRPLNVLKVDERYETVDITAEFGWPETPLEVVEANLILAHRIYKRSDTPGGVGGFDSLGNTYRLPWRDPDVELMLAPYRKVVFG